MSASAGSRHGPGGSPWVNCAMLLSTARLASASWSVAVGGLTLSPVPFVRVRHPLPTQPTKTTSRFRGPCSGCRRAGHCARKPGRAAHSLNKFQWVDHRIFWDARPLSPTADIPSRTSSSVADAESGRVSFIPSGPLALVLRIAFPTTPEA
jgi:hypothetical protein